MQTKTEPYPIFTNNLPLEDESDLSSWSEMDDLNQIADELDSLSLTVLLTNFDPDDPATWSIIKSWPKVMFP